MAVYLSSVVSSSKLSMVLIQSATNASHSIKISANTVDRQHKFENCLAGIRLAEEKLKVERVVAPRDLSHTAIDDRSVATYVSSFCKCANTLVLNWVQKLLPERKITNLDADWSDGVNLACLMNALVPGSLPNCQKLNPESARDNFTEAMKICETRLGVKPHSTLAEGNVDELSMATYLAQLKYAKSVSDGIVCRGVGLTKAFLGMAATFEINGTKRKKELTVADLDVTITDGKNELIKPEIIPNGKGCFQVKYVAWSTEKLKIGIKWKNIIILPSPFNVDVIDMQSINFTTKDQYIKVGHPIATEVKGVDEHFEDLEVSLWDANGGKAIKADNTEKKSEGIVEYSFTAAKIGKYKLVAKFYEAEIPGSLKGIEFVDPKLYSVRIQEPVQIQESSSTKVNEPAVFIIKTSGADYSSLVASVQTPGSAVPKPVKLVEQTGSIVGRFTPAESGDYKVIVTCVGEHVCGSPIQLSVCDPNECFFNDELPHYVQVGVPHSINLSTKGAGPGKLEVSSSQEEVLTVNWQQNEDGTGYTIHLSPKMIGESTIDVKFDNTLIKTDHAVSVCDASKCIAFGTVIETKSVKCSEAFEITVQTKEAGKGELSATMTHRQTKTKHNPTKDSEGTYSLSLTSFEAGEHNIHIFWGSVEIPKSPFSVKVSCDAVQFLAEGDGLKEATAHRATMFELNGPQSGLVQEDMLHVSVKGTQFESKMVDEEKFDPSSDEALVCVTDKQKGSYLVKYCVPDHGNCTLYVDIDNKSIPSSPFNVKVRPAFDPSRCVASGTAIDNPNGLVLSKSIEFKVDTTNAGTGELTAMATDSSHSEMAVSIEKDKSSFYNQEAYVVRVDPTTIGKYSVNVYWNGEIIRDSPFNFEVCDPTKVKVLDLPSPLEYIAEVNKPLTFTVDPKGAGRGQLECNVKTSDVKDGEVREIKVEPKQQEDGTILFEYTPYEVGQMQLSLTYNGESILPSAWECEITNVPTCPPTFETTESEENAEEETRLGQEVESRNGEKESFVQDINSTGEEDIQNSQLESSVDPIPEFADEDSGQATAADHYSQSESVSPDVNQSRHSDEDNDLATDHQSSQTENTVSEIDPQNNNFNQSDLPADDRVTEVVPPAVANTTRGEAMDSERVTEVVPPAVANTTRGEAMDSDRVTEVVPPAVANTTRGEAMDSDRVTEVVPPAVASATRGEAMDSDNESDEDAYSTHKPLTIQREDSPTNDSHTSAVKNGRIIYGVQVGVPFSFNFEVQPNEQNTDGRKPTLEPVDSNKEYDIEEVEKSEQGVWKATCTAWDEGEQDIRVLWGERELSQSPIKIYVSDRKLSGSNDWNFYKFAFFILVAAIILSVIIVAIGIELIPSEDKPI